MRLVHNKGTKNDEQFNIRIHPLVEATRSLNFGQGRNQLILPYKKLLANDLSILNLINANLFYCFTFLPFHCKVHT